MVPIIPKQRQHRPNASKRFNDLIDYLQGEQEQAKKAPGTGQGAEPTMSGTAGPTVQSSDFSDLLDYATAAVDTKVPGEKCIGIRTHGVSSLETASLEMNAVSRKNRRCQDPVYHFILSWPEHEKPAPAAIFDAAEHAIKALGFEEHQYVVAIHANTDNIHCHVAMNRVHPTTFKSRHIEWAKRTLHFAARESEIKHGWTHDNGIYVVEVDGQGKKQIVLNTKHAEAEQGPHAHPEIERDDTLPAWHDPEGLAAWLKSSVAKALKEDLPALTSWQALHVWLERFDISLKDTGGGGLRLRAVSPETGEIFETPASKGLRLITRPELEKRWGAYKPPFTNPVLAPSSSHLTTKQLTKGIDHVIGLVPDNGPPPPDHFTGLDGDADRSLPQGGGGLHDVPDLGVAAGGQVPEVLLPAAVQSGVGDGEAGQDQGVRPAGPRDSGGGGGREPIGQGGDDPAAPARRDPLTGRKERDPVLRAQRKAERAAARADLRKRFAQYRNFVAAGDTEHFAKLKELRDDRSRQRKEIDAEAKAAKAGVRKDLDREVRLISIIAIDAEVTRRKLAVESKYQDRADALRATRMPPLSWREWLFEQSNRADKAALSALRGIVYQAQRDAKLPKDAEDEELDDLAVSAADHDELQHKRLMARLLAEERKEAAIRASSLHRMRPHEVDALVLAYAGLQWRVTGNGNVEYSRGDGQHLFTDRGNRVTFDRMRVTDDEIKLALVHSREKFGRQLTLTGEEPVFVSRMARLADDLGLKVLNPELQAVIEAHRQSKKLAAGAVAKTEAQQTLQSSIRDGHAVAQQGPAALVEATEPTVQGELSARALDPLPEPSEPTVPTVGEEGLRAAVLAIDPRARFEVADPLDETRQYVGPIVAAGEGLPSMFAQHLGRGAYAIHRLPAPSAIDDGIVEVRYRSGVGTISSTKQGRSQER